jgi:hypothetical protein
MPDGGGEEGATVVAADANADEQVEPDPVDLGAALARAAAEAAAASAADGPRDSAGL